MTRDDRSRRNVVLAALGVVALFAVATAWVYAIGERQALARTEDMLAYSCSDLPDTLRGIRYSTLLLEANVVVGELSATNPPPVSEMRRIVDACALDELHLVGCYGKVLASSEPSALGRDLTIVPSMVDFLSLVETPTLLVEQPIRLSIADSRTEVSYAGLPLADGSLLICGMDVEHLRYNFIASFGDLMTSWKVSDSGRYAIVDDRTGKLVFDVQDMAKAGERFADVADPAVLEADFDVDVSHIGHLFGRLCHYRVFDCYGLRVVVFISHDEFFAPVKVMTLRVSGVLLLIFLVFGFAFRRVMQANRAIARMREQEDRQRLKDMVMATSIQKHSLPTAFPPYPSRVDDFDIYAFMQTAREVGGDFYDFYFVEPEKVALVVADVSGKGVPAAMFMMRAKTTIQGLLKSGVPLVEAVAKANDHLCEGNLEDMFVTSWVGICDLQTGEVEYVNAGHNPPLVRRRDGSVEWVRERSGLVLAALEGRTYRSHTLSLAPGDALVLYTDGVTEAQNAAGELYGEDRLERATLETDIVQDARQYCDGILESLGSFVGGAEQADDITMLAFRLKRLVPREQSAER